MANFKDVNKAIKRSYPGLVVEAVREVDYVRFTGGFATHHNMGNLYAPPVCTPTERMIELCLGEIKAALDAKPEPLPEQPIAVPEPRIPKWHDDHMLPGLLVTYPKGLLTCAWLLSPD